MDYAVRHMLRYFGASEEDREKTKSHWIKCYAEALADEYEESAAMSARIIANMALVDSGFFSNHCDVLKRILKAKNVRTPD